VHFRGCAVMTNTIPTTPYRSAGRPEAIYIMERLVDLAAQQCGFDPVELRRKNFIRPNAFPYTNGVGITYDNGEYELGLGTANYIEGAGGAPRERAEITVGANGRVELVLGTMNSGQGHETSFPQLICEWLGVPFNTIDYVAHDTDRVKAGGGSHSGRSMRIASLAIGEATDVIIEKGRKLAAHILEVSPVDVDFAKGVFTIRGTDRHIGIFE